MAKIKCRWEEPYCRANRRGGGYDFGRQCFNDYGCSDVGCENYYPEENGRECCNIEYDTYQIEKEVKSYELTDTMLTMGRKTIEVDNMLELIIDGEEFAFTYSDIDPYRLEQVIDWYGEEESEEEYEPNIYKRREAEVLKSNNYPRIKKALENGKTLDEIEMSIQVGLGDWYYNEFIDLMGCE